MRGGVPGISVIILAKNEEIGIGSVLARLGDFDDVIVVDSHSTDRTAQIAQEAGARVVQFAWDGAYPKKKQWSLENSRARHPWVLCLDADEWPTSSLLNELRGLRLEADGPAAYDIHLRYRFAGRLLRHGHVVTKRALVDVRRCAFPEFDDLDSPGLGEVEGHYQPRVDGSIGTLRARLVHDDQDPVRSWFDRHNRYSDWEAHLRMNETVRQEVAARRTLKGRVFDGVPFKPLAFFFYAYVVRGGFLDGRAGLDYALALSFYYWQIGVKYRELRRDAG